MEVNTSFSEGSSTPDSLSPTKVPVLTFSDFFSRNSIVISISSISIGVVLIIIFILLLRKIRGSCCLNSKVLEAYNTINYDTVSIDDELDNCDDLLYTSCKLYVDNDLGVDSDMSNEEPEYCVSVDVSVNANESSIGDLNRGGNIQEAVEQQGRTHNLKITPHSFWRR